MSWLLNRSFKLLEPYEGKPSRTVLRGESGSDPADLPDKILAGAAPVNVFELGLGTGLNALLTLIEAEEAGRQVMYEAVEAYPLGDDEVRQLDYCTLLGRPDMKTYFEQLHTCDWETLVPVTPYFTLYKSRDVWPDHVLRQPAGLVYYDAFDPVVQPGLWTADVFERLAGQLASGALLVTYCCKGAVRRAMQSAGFRVEKRPGPPGKREIVRAWLS